MINDLIQLTHYVITNELTWLARNVHTFEGGKNFIAVSGDLYFYRDKPPHGISFSRDEWLARRAELQNKPSWADAPEWARSLAQHSVGRWTWYEEDPSPNDNGFWVDGGVCQCAGEAGEVLGDWRDTLERRPVDLSEPAGGVKERGADGAEEINAMAQRLLVALKSEPRSFDTGALAEMVELADAEIVKRDAKVCGGEGYLNNHWFDRGELPPVGEFVDVEGEDLVYGDGELNCEVIAHVEDTAVIRMSYGLGCFQKHVLSPSRTERDKAIDGMKQHCPHHGSWDTVGRIYAEALYDAGYRKQVSPAD